ncbi:MAG: enoyl-CoA hydratase/isomerase family protein [Chloracidobacterium sp.]|uniref:3-hydroxyisobutyryl-CoA hydrolase n=1 Tax=Chloracidobacterium validum TaxID=2821543 RepID=A0ABX8BH00_9BACT|nr:enoyl-CoA hydratase/isomerase family protein [Chloracidobacterium validum]QUW04365.1 enoyl-CoA hydratase/isomerase family protein [Chloracidobacterium validum]
MHEEHLRFEKTGKVALLTLNRPQVINVLTTAMLRALDRALDDIAADETIQSVVLRGAGARGFCAGADVKWLRQCVLDGQPELGDEFFAVEYALDLRLHTFPKPIVALMEGVTMGGGLGLAIGARHRVATPTTRLAMPEVHIGFFPDVGASWFLRQLPGAWGRYLALTGASIDGATARALGLATHYLDAPPVADLVDRLQAAPAAVALDALAQVPPPSIARDEWIETHFAHGSPAEILSSLETATDERSTQAAQSLRAASPFSVALTWELLCSSPPASLEAAFAREGELARQAIRHPDYAEGVRARLVDKDFNPRWAPPS